MTDHLLAIDLGTSGPKVGLVGTDGTIAASDFEPVKLHLLPGGGAEQDPADWWRAITAATNRMLAAAAVPLDLIIGICPTAQWSGTVPLDESGRPLTNALIWMDSRGAPDIRELIGGPIQIEGYDVRKLRTWIRLTGGGPGKAGKDPLAHILWLRRERPEVYADTAVFLEPKDYLLYRLTGRVAATTDSIALHWLTDNRDPERISYHPRLLDLAGIERERLPDLIEPTAVAGTLTAAAAADLGLPAGLEVIGGTPDLHSAAIGSGGVADYAPHLYIGTSDWLGCHVPFKKTDVLRNVASLPAALPGRYLVANEQETAGACLDYLADVFFLDAPEDRSATYRMFDSMAAATEPGSGGVIFTPWLYGERTPVEDADLRAAFFNISMGTRAAHLVRAVFEGVAYNTRWLLGAVERFTGRRLEPITLVGGGARSEVWAQIFADVLGRRIRRAADPISVNLRGAGLLGALALDEIDATGIAAAVPIAGNHEPDRTLGDLHEARFREFLSFHKANRRGYRRLNRSR